MYRPLDLNNELECELIHPIEARLRNMFLEMVRKHGNGLWAYDELFWFVYEVDKDRYETLNEEDKYILNMFMKTFGSLYK